MLLDRRRLLEIRARNWIHTPPHICPARHQTRAWDAKENILTDPGSLQMTNSTWCIIFFVMYTVTYAWVSKRLFEGGGWQYEGEGPWGHLTSFILHAGASGLPPGSLACAQYAQGSMAQCTQEHNMHKVQWHTVHKAVNLWNVPSHLS